MMESTIKQCHEMYISPSKQYDNSTHKSPKPSPHYAQKEEKRKTSMKEEKQPVSKKASSFLKGSNKENLSSSLNSSEKGKSMMGAKIEEPKDLNV